MAAMMVPMVVLMVMGPHHGFMGSHYTTSPKADALHMQTDRTVKPLSIETPEA